MFPPGIQTIVLYKQTCHLQLESRTNNTHRRVFSPENNPQIYQPSAFIPLHLILFFSLGFYDTVLHIFMGGRNARLFFASEYQGRWDPKCLVAKGLIAKRPAEYGTSAVGAYSKSYYLATK